ncbi:MAG: hypothetical protein ACE5EW_08030 [Thermoplasmata archaeon]
MRGSPFFLLLAVLAILGSAQAQPTAWIQLDTNPPESAGDGPPPADMVDLYFGSNSTHAFFREDLVASPDVGNYTYVVYLDYPRAGAFDPDYRLVHAQSGSYLEQWDGSTWTFVEAILVTFDPTNTSLIFEVAFASIGGLLDKHMDVWFENYDGADSFQNRVDKAPNGNKPYRIHKKVIPNLPGFVLPAFAAGLVTTLFVIRRKFLPS